MQEGFSVDSELQSQTAQDYSCPCTLQSYPSAARRSNSIKADETHARENRRVLPQTAAAGVWPGVSGDAPLALGSSGSQPGPPLPEPPPPLRGRSVPGWGLRVPPARHAPSALLAFRSAAERGRQSGGTGGGAAPLPMAAAAGRAQPGSAPPLLLPPGLREELRQRRRDLRRLEAAAGGGGAAAAGRLGCGDLSRATAVSILGWGFTKVVARAVLEGGGAVALKSVHGAGREVRRCVQRYGAPAGCRRLAAYKVLKEVTLLQRLQHPGIVQLHGQCYENSGDAELRVTAMLELGSPLEMIQLLQTPWEERFKICLSLVKLLFYLAHSPLGSIVLLDFQPRQFVMVDGNLKVTDMDDASTEELSCKEDIDCTLDFPTKSFPLRCSAAGKCEGINEKKNLFNAYRYFFTYLLPHSAPPTLRPLLSDILNATGDLRYGINETMRAFEKVLHLYKSGLYLQKRPLLLKDYISLKGFRTVEGEDYKCWPSYSHLGCLLSIHSAEEAAAICNSQSQCQSFIITQQRTWTGRPLASFQSSWTDLIPDTNAVVYIKRSASSGERL
ncbi:extracellular tyrosine-protein kinase PKDCC-like [Corapipo altera]|uniref:extracellular tyrosine-protein kinase PKDCC-like n=1 Tax=Corapipo altera TaxID=415028 RepID=UPI000FD69430|nr:extracellular tyrosine-protein kinase PKDCC-like [Corapipo altera]